MIGHEDEGMEPQREAVHKFSQKFMAIDYGAVSNYQPIKRWLSIA
jgi:hypothetical protein